MVNIIVLKHVFSFCTLSIEAATELGPLDEKSAMLADTVRPTTVVGRLSLANGFLSST